MDNPLCKMFGIEAPIFAFSHCRDVVVEVSKAGGLGVLGLARMNPERVVADLREETSVRRVVQDMLAELADSKQRLDRLLG